MIYVGVMKDLKVINIPQLYLLVFQFQNKFVYLLLIDRVYIVYCESIKRELKRRLIYEYRWDKKLKTKKEESTRLTDTGLVVDLKHLKTKTENISDPRFEYRRKRRVEVVEESTIWLRR
jgi:tRNA A37 threonylcarbamoyladenosine modification protein TsaB